MANIPPQPAPSVGSEETFRLNRATWDERATIHAADTTGFYGVEGFLAGDDRQLLAIELEELGPVAGLDLIHLQCHIGLDTLALARRGARVTGLDFSSASLAVARDLATRAGLEARFVEANVYDAADAIAERFDVVFASWGVITWIPDVARWLGVAARLLRPGGRLYLADMHPFAMCMDVRDGALTLGYPWKTSPDQPIAIETPTTYNGDPTELVNRKTHEFSHPVSALLDGTRAAGLETVFFHEHEVLAWEAFPGFMQKDGAGLQGEAAWRMKPGAPSIPLSFSLMARKPVTSA